MSHYLRVTDRISPERGAFFPAGKKVPANKFSSLTRENLRLINNENMTNILDKHLFQIEIRQHVFIPTDQLIGSLKQVNSSTKVWFENNEEPQSFEDAMTCLKSFLKQDGTSVSFDIGLTRRIDYFNPGEPLGLSITRKRLNEQCNGGMRFVLPSLYYAEDVKPSLPTIFPTLCYFPYFFHLGSKPEHGFTSGMFPEFIS